MNKLTLVLLLVLLALPMVFAETAELDTEISAEDKAQFDEILTPIMKIYNMVKYFSSVIAGIVLLWAGISYMTSGADPRKRDTSKNIATYVVIGLVVIWAAPFIVNLFV
tara:strand:- start:291 stop:617 length:327 start_codon:yes stop_codon:yes gene_type:complete